MLIFLHFYIVNPKNLKMMENTLLIVSLNDRVKKAGDQSYGSGMKGV